MRAAVAVLVAAGLLLGGCSSDVEALRRQALDDAVAATFTGPVAFNLGIGASEDALAAFGVDAGPLGALLAGSSVAGVLEEDRVAVGLSLGGVDVLQARVVAPGEQYVRFDLGALAALAGGPDAADEQRVEDRLREAGLDAAARAAVLAAVRGEWVRLEPDDPAATDGGVPAGEALAALLRSFTPTGHDGAIEDGEGRVTVVVDVERALAAGAEVLAGVAPGSVPSPDEAGRTLDGRVLLDAGLVRSVVVRLGPLIADGPTSPEASGAVEPIELSLDLRPLEPEVPLVVAPSDAVTLTTEQLSAAVDVLG